MYELFKSELLRLRKGALIGLLAFITLFFMAPRLGFWEILHRNMGFIVMAGAIVLSLAFGIVHGLLWRKKKFWVFLIHRPLAPMRIYLSLMGAAVAAIFTSVFLSLFITTVSYDAFTDRVVDMRHYLFILYITLLSIACYMVGNLTVLHRSRFTILTFYTLAIAFFPEPQNMLAQFLPLILMLGGLFYLNMQCFKPDLNQPIGSALATSLLATGTSYGLGVVLIFATVVFYHLPLTIVGQHPDMDPKDGSMKKIWVDNFRHGVGYVLENSDHPQAQHYARQASLAQRRNLPIQQWQPPRPHQLHRFDNSDALYNPDTGDIWKFSHDEMLLLGMSSLTGKFIGAIGHNGLISDLNQATDADRFSDVPHLSGEQFLSTENALYALDFDTHTLLLKHKTELGEYYTSSLWVGEQKALMSTNTHLLLFDISTLLDDFSQLHVDHQVAYPDSTTNAEFAYGLPVADGYLLLFLAEHYFGFDRPGAEVYITRLDGSFEHLGGREFHVYDHPAWIRHYNFMVAPFIYVTEELLMHSIDPYDSRFLGMENLKLQYYPNAILAVAITLQLASIFVLWRLTHGATLTTSLRRTWFGLVAVLGLPALISYLLLHPIRSK